MHRYNHVYMRRSLHLYKISPELIQPLASNVNTITNCPDTQSLTNLRKLLGMVNVYHRFIPNGAKLQQPLITMISGNKKNSKASLSWNEKSRSAFQSIKKVLLKSYDAGLPCSRYSYFINNRRSSLRSFRSIAKTTFKLIF